MRSHILILSTFLVLIGGSFTSSCRRGGPQSTVRMSDLHTKKQLISGFYELESGAWRWTGKDFKVQLKAPADAAKNGAQLVLQGNLSEKALENGPVTLRASIDDYRLEPQTLSKAGDFICRVDVPPAAIDANVVVADFKLDKVFHVPGDLRNLGVIASVISLRSK